MSQDVQDHEEPRRPSGMAPVPVHPTMDDALAAALAAVEALEQQGTPRPGATELPRASSQELANLQADLVAERRNTARVQGELETAHGDLAATRRRFQRLDQEHEELRKRAQRQELDLPTLGARNFLAALLPALDDLDAVATHLEQHEGLSAQGREALAMLRDHWNKALQNAQVQSFDAMGQRFDPTVHEVIAQSDDAQVPAGTVIRQISRGYLHAGKLVRCAKVVVSR